MVELALCNHDRMYKLLLLSHYILKLKYNFFSCEQIHLCVFFFYSTSFFVNNNSDVCQMTVILVSLIN